MTTHYDQYLAPHLEMVRGIVRRHSYPASETADNFQSVVLVLLEHLEELGALAQGALGGATQFDPRPWISTVTLHALSTLNRRAQRHRATHLTPAGRPRADEEEGANEALAEGTNAGCLPDPLMNNSAAAADPFAPSPRKRHKTRRNAGRAAKGRSPRTTRVWKVGTRGFRVPVFTARRRGGCGRQCGVGHDKRVRPSTMRGCWMRGGRVRSRLWARSREVWCCCTPTGGVLQKSPRRWG